MSWGIYGLTSILEEILTFLEKTFTKELIDKFSLTTEQASNLMQQISDSGLIDGMKTFFETVNRQELAVKLGMTLEEVNTLIKKFSDAEIIENFGALLKKVNTYADLIGLEDFLKQYGHLLPYAAVGCAVFSTLLPVALAYAASRADSQFKEYLKQRIDLLAATSMQNMKFNAGSFLLLYESTDKSALSEKDQKQLQSLAGQAKHIIEFTPDLDMSQLEKFSRELFNHLYISVGSNPLDGVTQHLNPDIIRCAATGDIKALNLSNDGELTYALVKRQYGELIVDNAMKRAATALSQAGGSNIYYAVRHSQASREKAFNHVMQRIYTAVLHQAQLKDKNEATFLTCFNTQLRQMISESVNDALKAEHETIAHDKEDTPQTISEQAISVIRNRALVEFAHQTSGYFYFPWNLKEEVIAGAADVVDDFHPDTLAQTFSSLTLGSSSEDQPPPMIANHPANPRANRLNPGRTRATFGDRPFRRTAEIAGLAVGAITVGVVAKKKLSG